MPILDNAICRCLTVRLSADHINAFLNESQSSNFLSNVGSGASGNFIFRFFTRNYARRILNASYFAR